MTKKYKVEYESLVDFLTWTIFVEAINEFEAHKKGSEKGKVLCVKLLQELD